MSCQRLSQCPAIYPHPVPPTGTSPTSPPAPPGAVPRGAAEGEGLGAIGLEPTLEGTDVQTTGGNTEAPLTRRPGPPVTSCPASVSVLESQGHLTAVTRTCPRSEQHHSQQAGHRARRVSTTDEEEGGVGHLHDEVSFSHQKKRNCAICRALGGTRDRHVEQNEPNSEHQGSSRLVLSLIHRSSEEKEERGGGSHRAEEGPGGGGGTLGMMWASRLPGHVHTGVQQVPAHTHLPRTSKNYGESRLGNQEQLCPALTPSAPATGRGSVLPTAVVPLSAGVGIN